MHLLKSVYDTADGEGEFDRRREKSNLILASDLYDNFSFSRFDGSEVHLPVGIIFRDQLSKH